MKRIYLDYAATTPVDADAFKAMTPYFSEQYGNPSSVHVYGREAQAAVDEARGKITATLSCLLQEVIFTASATEANNMAVFGALREASRGGRVAHVITSVIEHKSLREPIAAAAKEFGAEITEVTVTKDGLVRPEDVERAFRENTALVSIMYANNEIGTVQPITDIAKAIRAYKGTHKILFHTDAVQAANYLPLSVTELGVDMMTLSSHKIYGPKGIGALYLKKGTPFSPLIFGSGQEYGKRSGTENVPGIIGFGAALEKATREREKESSRVKELRDYFIAEVLTHVPSTALNGSKTERLPNNVNILFRSREAQDLILSLDLKGIAVSAGSACQSKAVSESYVLSALGLSKKDASSSIRFSFGKYTTKEDIDATLAALVQLTK